MLFNIYIFYYKKIYGDWGLGIGPNPQSPIPNPQSPIPNIKNFYKKLNNFINHPFLNFKLIFKNLLIINLTNNIFIKKSYN